MTTVVLGRSGQVARALSLIEVKSDQSFEFVGRDRCDMSDILGMEKLLDELRPDAIINAAAYTAVDTAQVDQENAHLINVTAPARVAKLAHDWNIPFIHLSTDYVFDGTKDGPYIETDPTNPLNVYGLTKRDGENEVIAACPNAVVLRTSWVYSQFGKNFLRTMLTLAQTRDVLTVIDDQWGAPTAASDIALACVKIAQAKQAGAKSVGIFHMTGGGQTTWRRFAQAAFDKTTQWRNGKKPVVNPIKTADYPPLSSQTVPTPRPLNSRLNCDLLDMHFGIRLPHWEDSLDNTLAALENEFGARNE